MMLLPFSVQVIVEGRNDYLQDLSSDPINFQAD